ncbi:MAG: hypothetical protein A2Y34_07650 [Spirochaetes bacterium GWC1_27_15]|nr:MAG: hypothetical protein A2Z98_15155 [Spirochaetes bacterium GWB1_27_13]OHD26994.1 MAG: hypothetical protein A2Y34_07650 [Spirochaetes bacterium GWC1_27_15]
MKNNKKLFILLFSLLSIFIVSFGCIPNSTQITTTTIYNNQDTDVSWDKNLSMYEVNIRQYSNEGTFNSFIDHISRLKKMGVGIVWFMPIHPIGVVNRKGTLGSYYAIKDYYGINPEFGNIDDFKNTVKILHSNGMKVIIDWVANHTSPDNNLTKDHPEWYVKNTDGNFIPPNGTDWTDVIQFDFSKKELREYMINVMKYWITEADIDGFRCDAVDWVGLDFWKECIPQLNKIKPVIMLAESQNPDFYAAGFRITYGWDLLNKMKNIANGTADLNIIETYINSELTNIQKNNYRLLFTSNHDQNSWSGTVYELFGNYCEPFAVLTYALDGIPLIYSGQEAGLNKRLQFFEKDPINWTTDKFENIYTRLNQLKLNNEAMWNRNYDSQLKRVKTDNNNSIFIISRENNNNTVIFVFNFSNTISKFTITESEYNGNYKDLFSETNVSFSQEQIQSLNPYEYKVLIRISN